MKQSTRNILAVLLASVWINASEFFRNEVLLKSHWVAHYQSLGLVFPSAPLNGALWVAWGFLFAVALFLISRKFGLLQTAFIGWLSGFVLMWVVTWNLNVLPSSILVYAVPLSLLEAFVAAAIYAALRPARE
ncbi:MAG: hypothetical protein WCH44_04430 [Betaproteobacteria bacterium]